MIPFVLSLDHGTVHSTNQPGKSMQTNGNYTTLFSPLTAATQINQPNAPYRIPQIYSFLICKQYLLNTVQRWRQIITFSTIVVFSY